MNATGTTQETIAVVGIGRVGLPLALAFAEAGLAVHGIDVRADLIETLKAGRMPFIEEGAVPLLERHVGRRFFPGQDLSVVAGARAVILTIGTPVDEHMNPLFLQIENVLAHLAPHFQKGQLLVLRSTVAPGTTEYVQRFIEKRTGFAVGQDFFLAFCPERIAEGKSIEEIPQIPQIVGGIDSESTRLASALFLRITKKVLATDSRSAELAKLFTNMYRYIDFAIANEFMVLAQDHGRDIHHIVDLVNRDYKRGGLKSPGFAGGPCLYKDGFFLLSRVPFSDLVSTAWKINETVPAFLIAEIRRRRTLNGAKVAILGLTFKKNIDDTRNSLSYKARKIFHAEGARVALHDPFVQGPPVEEVLSGASVVLLAVNHDLYRDRGRALIDACCAPDTLVCDLWNLFGMTRIYVR
jgi:UDP-N-acetyl-D-mannosaminuronic acid dehydrogenase